MAQKIKVATRTSILALTQCNLVLDDLKKNNPDLEIEIIGVSNMIGDRDKSTPLSELGTIGVFTKGIDDLVLSGEADIAIHSLKDVGTQRPGTLKTICIPKRGVPHDIALFRHRVLDKLFNDEEIVIGTSSPRREALVPAFLEKALPKLGKKKPRIKIVNLRGNIHSRIQKMLGIKENDHELDGCVLAFAGLSRLYSDDEGRNILDPLLKQCRMMIMPLSECPTAPGQGALAVEALAEREDLQALFSSVHHRPTEQSILTERNILIEQGGGCHQAFGVTCIKLPNIDEKLLVIRGKNKDGVDISEDRWLTPQNDIPFNKLWNGLKWRNDIFETDMLEHPPIHAEAVFVSHSRAISDTANYQVQNKRIWTSGVNSWFRLAEKGLWVEGCADGFGFDDLIKSLLIDPALRLPACKNWDILTHEEAGETWEEGHVVPTYRLKENLTPETLAALKEADHVFWSSFTQFKLLHHYAKPNAVHMCGPGKTAKLIKDYGIDDLIIAPNFEELEKLLHKKQG